MVCDGVGVGVPDGVPVGVGEPDGVAVGEGDPDGVADGDTDAELDAVAEWLTCFASTRYDENTSSSATSDRVRSEGFIGAERASWTRDSRAASEVSWV